MARKFRTGSKWEQVPAGDNARPTTWLDYLRFAVFVAMLLIPVYAIARSAIKHDWVMMVIDALFVPVGFVHGLLLLLGVVG